MRLHRAIAPLGLVAFTACNAETTPRGTITGNGVAMEEAASSPVELIIDPALSDEDERNNLSGAACAPDGPCLLVGDEKRYARVFSIAGNKLVPGARVFLLPDKAADGGKMKESDAEGVAYADSYFYVIGSHSNSKSGKVQPSRHFLWRVPVKVSAATDLGSESAPAAEVEAVSLDYLIGNEPAFAAHLKQAAGELALRPDELSEDAAAGEEEKNTFGEDQHGPNIEGIAVSGDNLFIGFRGPADDDGAYLYKVPLGALFAGQQPPRELIRLPLGAEGGVGQGVRDLAAVTGGLLILSGPEMRSTIRRPADWASGASAPKDCSRACPRPELWLWNTGNGLRKLDVKPADLGADNPESLTVLSESHSAIRLLVMSDGKSGSAPRVIEVPK